MQRRTHPESNIPNYGQVSLTGVYIFFREFWKLILFSGIVGITFALIYVFVFSPRFEVVGLVNMAHFIDNEVYPPQATYIEEPSQLLDRFSSNNEVLPDCGFLANKKGKNAIVVKKLVPSSVELKIDASDSDLALACSKAIFEWIAASQILIADSKLRIAKTQLKIVNERIAQNQIFLSDLQSSKLFSSNAFSDLLKNKRDLEDEAKKLQKSTLDLKFVAAKLAAPLEVRDLPGYAKCIQSILGGLSGGVFMGLFLSLMIQMFRQLKLEFSILSKH